MKRMLAYMAALCLALLVWGCDSGGDDGDDGNGPPVNLITGYYCVIQAPAGTTVSYRIVEFDEHGMEVDERDPIVVDFESASTKVLDLYAADMDPHGVAVSAKLVSGTGLLKVELWHDADLQASAETAQVNHEVCVRGGTGG